MRPAIALAVAMIVVLVVCAIVQLQLAPPSAANPLSDPVVGGIGWLEVGIVIVGSFALGVLVVRSGRRSGLGPALAGVTFAVAAIAAPYAETLVRPDTKQVFYIPAGASLPGEFWVGVSVVVGAPVAVFFGALGAFAALAWKRSRSRSAG
jgi:hypothetical protein